MANTKISNEVAASALDGTEIVPLVQGGANKRTTAAAIAAIPIDTDTSLTANSDTKVASQKAVKAYIASAVTGLLDFKGSTDCSANPNYPAASKGDYYLVSVAGKIGGASGSVVGAGDSYYATADNAGGTQAGVGSSWDVVEGNLGFAPVNKAGDTMSGDLSVPDEAYDATAWNGSLEVPTKNAIRDKLEGIYYEAGPRSAPTTADLATWINQGTSTVTDASGALLLKPQVDGLVHGREKAAPTAPYDIYARIDYNMLSTAAVTGSIQAAAGISLRDSSDGELIVVGVFFERISGDEQNTYAVMIQRWTNPTTFSATPLVRYGTALWQWLRVNVTATTVTVYVSNDGRTWHSVGTETIATFVDAIDRIGVYSLANSNSTEAIAEFSYYSTTAPA